MTPRRGLVPVATMRLRDAVTNRTRSPARPKPSGWELLRAVVAFRKQCQFLCLSNVGDKLRDALARGVRKHDP